ncbi:NOP5/NOP56 family protein [Halorientalis litorea]|uniref:NOP5/NOP56 family protein n=1 Tax=Halorientalis litorea TaxID=2931977 RepID=UPI001FF0F272|nr:NOP5/NOP56 family protein [Halorientalis litorea]
MNETTGNSGWFDGPDPGDTETAAAAVREGHAEQSHDWPTEAVESGFAEDRAAYYDQLHEATMAATRAAVRERERADDQQLVHAVRAMDDCRGQANELAERVAEWAGSRFADAGTGIESCRQLAARETADAADRRVVSLARRVVALDEEADELRSFVETTAPEVAPNLAALAGPVLAARLVALAGGLEPLAKKPSGTVQVLGAEDALFAHLRGQAPSPKHGVIYTHEAVQGAHPSDRGSAARALAGKLAIAARIDHYSGDLRPELEEDLTERIATIHARGDGDE